MFIIYYDLWQREETEVFKMLAELKRQGRLIYQPLPFRIGQGDYVFLQHGASADFEIAEEYLKSGNLFHLAYIYSVRAVVLTLG